MRRPKPAAVYRFDTKIQICKKKICKLMLFVDDHLEFVNLAHSNFEITESDFDSLVKYIQCKYEPKHYSQKAKWRTNLRHTIKQRLICEHIGLIKGRHHLLNKLPLKRHDDEWAYIANFYNKSYSGSKCAAKIDLEVESDANNNSSRSSNGQSSENCAPSCTMVKETVFVQVDLKMCKREGSHLTTRIENITRLLEDKVKFDRKNDVIMSVVQGDISPEEPIQGKNVIEVPNDGLLKVHLNRRKCTFPRHNESLSIRSTDDSDVFNSSFGENYDGPSSNDSTVKMETLDFPLAKISTKCTIPKVQCAEVLFLKLLWLLRNKFCTDYCRKVEATTDDDEASSNLNANFVINFKSNTAMFRRNGLIERGLENWVAENGFQMPPVGNVHFRIPHFFGNMARELCYLQQNQNPDLPTFVVCINSEKHLKLGPGIMNSLQSGDMLRKLDKSCAGNGKTRTTNKEKSDHDEAHTLGQCTCKRFWEKLFSLNGDSSCDLTTVENHENSAEPSSQFLTDTNNLFGEVPCTPF